MLPDRNLLAGESSPYLLQHAQNPVHWRPWGRDALQESRETGKPILLSVGYAACHWCHVMAHESFENIEIADLMNAYFVNIKVDREERPDIDQIFMAALAAMGEQGGWPLTMFLTPDAQPFWGGTYFPPRRRYGRPGFDQVLSAVATSWREKPDDLTQSAVRLSQHIEKQLSSPQAQPTALDSDYFHKLTDNILSMMDMEKGGITGAPKFPNAPFLSALWLRWLVDRQAPCRDAVLLSLRKMLCGGIYDHVGGGLARYSTDDSWLVPHFEKMLYDNAQLVRLATWAFAETGDPIFARVVDETAGWMIRELSIDGAFASSFDADSEGGEGAFYTWRRDQVTSVLGEEDTAALLQSYTLEAPAGWEGDPILTRKPEENSNEAQMRGLLTRLRESRAQRPAPARDDKVLVDWNGLAIAALAEASRVFGRPDWADAAAGAYRFICESSVAGRLPHSIRQPIVRFPGLASDYAAMIGAATSLYEATWEETYLADARTFIETMKAWHGDESGTGFYLTAADAEDIPFRIRGDVDEALPSATAQIIGVVHRLALLEEDTGLQAQVLAIAEAALGRAETQAYGQTGIVAACALVERPMKLVLMSPAKDGAIVSLANRTPDLRRVDRLVRSEREAKQFAPQGAAPAWGTEKAYLCRGPLCLAPTDDVDLLRRELAKARS